MMMMIFVGDKQQAYQYHFDSYKNFPSNLETIDWLGSYFIELQVAEKAIVYFERAALMQPDEVKWQLMIASCYRRSGNYHKSLNTYRTVAVLGPKTEGREEGIFKNRARTTPPPPVQQILKLLKVLTFCPRIMSQHEQTFEIAAMKWFIYLSSPPLL